MKVKEFFKKGQEVWAITGQGIKKASYLRLEDVGQIFGCWRTVYLADLTDYKDKYGTISSCGTFYEEKVFTTREAAIEFLRTGKREDLEVAVEHESMFNVGDIGYRIGESGVISEIFTSVNWRIGQFEYHTNAGGAAVYPERGRWFHTREDAVEALISM